MPVRRCQSARLAQVRAKLGGIEKNSRKIIHDPLLNLRPSLPTDDGGRGHPEQESEVLLVQSKVLTEGGNLRGGDQTGLLPQGIEK